MPDGCRKNPCDKYIIKGICIRKETEPSSSRDGQAGRQRLTVSNVFSSNLNLINYVAPLTYNLGTAHNNGRLRRGFERAGGGFALAAFVVCARGARSG